eukprot:m.116430 g.116430  ORF g.116430 m.116430 type:complete len:120 (+) comp13609_c3_seq6:258-617(+)
MYESIVVKWDKTIRVASIHTTVHINRTHQPYTSTIISNNNEQHCELATHHFADAFLVGPIEPLKVDLIHQGLLLSLHHLLSWGQQNLPVLLTLKYYPLLAFERQICLLLQRLSGVNTSQ